MIRLARLTAVFVLVLTVAVAAEEKKTDKKVAGNGKGKTKSATFERLKSLAGDWVHAKEAKNPKAAVAISLRIIAGGSAIVEREFPGSPMEMVTVYHRDGDKVLMTHYCMLGNQPQMQVTQTDNPNKIAFKFIRATNLKSKNDAHMHEGWLQFIDKNHFKSSWTMFVDGKAAETHGFDFVRKKK